MTLADQVRTLEERCDEAMRLLGTICATLTLPRNVAELERDPSGKVIVELGRAWACILRRLAGKEPVDVAEMVARYGPPKKIPVPTPAPAPTVPGVDEPDVLIIIGASGLETVRFRLTRI